MNPLDRLREIASAFGFAGGSVETKWFDASNPPCHDAEKLLLAGRPGEAEKIFQKVLTEPRYAPLAKKHLPRILLALATAQLRQQKWEEADQSAARAWALLSELKYRTTPEYAECCRLRGAAARGRGAQEDALRLFLQGMGAVEAQKHPQPQEIVDRRIEIAALLREMERFGEAERMAAQAVQIAEEKLEGSRHGGDACMEWALCLAGLGRYEEARRAAERAAESHRAVCGDHSDELAQDYEKLGSICQKQGDFPAAVSFLEKALGIRERQVGGDASELALLMVALADLYSLIGRLAPALELLQQAVGKLGPSKDANLAGALEKLGTVYVRTGRYEDAAGCFQRAYDFWVSNPEEHAGRILSNRQAYENLMPWLPEPAAAPSRPETPDPGVSVLRGAGGSRPVATAGGPPAAWGSPPPVPLVPSFPAARQGFFPAEAAPPAHALSAGDAASGSAGQSAGAETAPPPAASLQPLERLAAPQASPTPCATPAAAPAPGATRDGVPAPAAGVHGRKDPHGFCGWEDLEFERLPRSAP